MESFNGKLRDECLNTSWFWNLFDAQEENLGVEERIQRGFMLLHLAIYLKTGSGAFRKAVLLLYAAWRVPVT